MLPKMHGMVLPFLDEPHDEEGREKVAREWLARVAPYCKAIRSNYNFPAKPVHLADIVREFGLQFVGGAWLDSDFNGNQKQIELLVQEARKGRLDIGLIGNEVLKQKKLEPFQLMGYLQVAQKKVPTAVFTVAETADDLLANPCIIDACDHVVGMHAYPFWDGIHINRAVEYLHEKYLAVKKIAGKKKVVVLETGWPTAGGKFRNAVASPENSRRYLANVSEWSRRMDAEVYFFEVMDEHWKHEPLEGADDTSNVGPHFGIWHADGRIKQIHSAHVAE